MKLALITMLLVISFFLFVSCSPGTIGSSSNTPNNPPHQDEFTRENQSLESQINSTNETGIEEVFENDYEDITPPSIPQ